MNQLKEKIISEMKKNFLAIDLEGMGDCEFSCSSDIHAASKKTVDVVIWKESLRVKNKLFSNKNREANTMTNT